MADGFYFHLFIYFHLKKRKKEEEKKRNICFCKMRLANAQVQRKSFKLFFDEFCVADNTRKCVFGLKKHLTESHNIV